MSTELLDRLEILRSRLAEIEVDGVDDDERPRYDEIQARIREVEARLQREGPTTQSGGINIDGDVEQARRLQQQLEAADDAAERAQLAQSLIEIYDRLEAQVSEEARRRGLPVQFTGSIQPDPNSPLAGLLDDIEPFGCRDEWEAALTDAPQAEHEPVEDYDLGQARVEATASYEHFQTQVYPEFRSRVGEAARRSRVAELFEASNLEEAYNQLDLVEGDRRQVIVTAVLEADPNGYSYQRVRFSVEVIADDSPRPSRDDRGAVRGNLDNAERTGGNQGERLGDESNRDLDQANASAEAGDAATTAAGLIAALPFMDAIAHLLAYVVAIHGEHERELAQARRLGARIAAVGLRIYSVAGNPMPPVTPRNLRSGAAAAGLLPQAFDQLQLHATQVPADALNREIDGTLAEAASQVNERLETVDSRGEEQGLTYEQRVEVRREYLRAVGQSLQDRLDQ